MVDLRVLSLAMLCATSAVSDEPDSLTLDCQVSAQPAYTLICADQVLREIAAEERRLDEARSARDVPPDHRLSQSLALQSHLFAREYCLGQTDPKSCLTTVLMQAVLEHWMTPQSPAQREDGAYPPDLIQCGDRVIYGISVGIDANNRMIGTGNIRSIVTLTVEEDVARLVGDGIDLRIDTIDGTVTLLAPLADGATCEIVSSN